RRIMIAKRRLVQVGRVFHFPLHPAKLVHGLAARHGEHHRASIGTWNAENEMTQASVSGRTVGMTYDGDNIRVAKSNGKLRRGYGQSWIHLSFAGGHIPLSMPCRGYNCAHGCP